MPFTPAPQKKICEGFPTRQPGSRLGTWTSLALHSTGIALESHFLKGRHPEVQDESTVHVTGLGGKRFWRCSCGWQGGGEQGGTCLPTSSRLCAGEAVMCFLLHSTSLLSTNPVAEQLIQLPAQPFPRGRHMTSVRQWRVRTLDLVCILS